jgi:ribulose-5-phosphate 4-epimerase/fuculose-1-phosphate aldolase
VQVIQIMEELVEGCCRLAGKGFLNTPSDSFSLRIPGQMEMILISGSRDWRQVRVTDIRTIPFSSNDDVGLVHAYIYQERGDVGAIAISSPKWVRMLARCGDTLPPIFDEQVRHIGSCGFLKDEEARRGDVVRDTFSRGANAAILGERLLCLGMTRDRVLFNTELYEKCAQAYVMAKLCGSRVSRIPWWVRSIAIRRLLKDEGAASASFRAGRIPEGINAY